MARYDYQCEMCNTVFEVKLTLIDKDAGKVVICTNCKSEKTYQLFNSIAVVGGNSSSSGSSASGSGCNSCAQTKTSCSGC